MADTLDFPPDVADLPAKIEALRTERSLPGFAIAIVRDGDVIVRRGFGVREVRRPDPVDHRTLFCIASNTKAFTAATLALLVDEGRLHWDDPVIRHLPHFQMYDPYVTREITLRDLLTHRSGLGLGQGDLLTFPATEFTRAEIVRRQRYLKPKTSFRSRYAYDNLLYIVAAEAVAAVAGQSWESFVRERLFEPLGMTATSTSVRDFPPGFELTSSHTRAADGEIVAFPFVHGENSNPAGGIYSNVTDLARWLQTQLSGGLIPLDPAQPNADSAPRRLFSEHQGREMWSPQTLLPDDSLAEIPPVPPSAFRAYGLGWGISEYQGHRLIAHNGHVAGMVSRTALVPARGIGIVVLTNLEDTEPLHAIGYTVLDRLLGLPETDWQAAFRAVRERENARAAEAASRQNATRATDSKPSLPLSAYSGGYRDDWFGRAVLTLENETLVFRLEKSPAMVADLEHYQHDTFIARWRDRTLNADAFLTFSLHPDATIDELKLAAVSPLTDFSFDFQDLLFRPERQ